MVIHQLFHKYFETENTTTAVYLLLGIYSNYCIAMLMGAAKISDSYNVEF